MIYATHAMMRPKLTTRVVRARCVGDSHIRPGAATGQSRAACLDLAGSSSPDLALVSRVHRRAGSARKLLGELLRVRQRAADTVLEPRTLYSRQRTRYTQSAGWIQRTADTVLGQTVRVAHDRHQTVLPTTARAPHL